MANLVAQIIVTDEEINTTFQSDAMTILKGDDAYSITVTATTGEASITIPAGITGGNGPGAMMIANLDTTAANSIKWGTDTADLDHELYAKDDGQNWEFVCLRDDQTTIYYQAAAGTPRLRILIWERGA